MPSCMMSCWLFWGGFSDKYVFCDVFSFPFPSFRMPSSFNRWIPPFPSHQPTYSTQIDSTDGALRFATPSIRCTQWDDTTISKMPLGLRGILLLLCRPYVLPTFSLCPSFIFTSPLSRFPPSFPLHLLPSLLLTSYPSLTSTHSPPSPANLLRALLRNNHPLPWRPPLTPLPDPPLKS